jgi:DNA mismatch repair protein MutL
LVNKIAAGEVIERPASIVKELIENSIDAKSKKIFVEIIEGGKSLIKITDDGIGMNKDDVKKSYLRHSTSKIKQEDDLFNINTLGFRGEALASIAAVSNLTIISKEKNELVGSKLLVKGGNQIVFEDFGSPSGTIIQIKELFYNTPARKKYLKSMEVELRHIIEIVTKYSLIYPDIHFQLIHGTKILVDNPSSDQLSNISFVYGHEFAKQMIPINFESNGFKLTGFISKPSLTKSTKDSQSIYVNNRYIKSNKTISDAINKAYHTLIMVNRYPAVVLNIDTDVSKTDVNVHPQKSQIRIANESKLYEAVYNGVIKTLNEFDLVPEQVIDVTQKLTDFTQSNFEQKYQLEDSEQELLVKESDTTQSGKLPIVKILGILNKTYILAEILGGMMLIDQHAAAERILYEKFMDELKKSDVKVQKLLNPEIIELNPVKYDLTIKSKDVLMKLGYNIEDFGLNTVIVRTIPILMGRKFDKTFFLDYLDLIQKGKLDVELLFHEKIASKACRSAIKAGDDITLPQIKIYIQELMQMNKPFNCPHGRPVMIKFSYYEIEKMFKRVV